MALVSQEDLACQARKGARYCATFESDVRHRRQTVRTPEEGEWIDAVGKEVLQEDEKDHELLHIDMGWGIRNRGPETLMHLPLEEDAPARVRSVRRHLQLAVFEERSNWGRAVGRLQRGDPA